MSGVSPELQDRGRKKSERRENERRRKANKKYRKNRLTILAGYTIIITDDRTFVRVEDNYEQG